MDQIKVFIVEGSNPLFEKANMHYKEFDSDF